MNDPQRGLVTVPGTTPPIISDGKPTLADQIRELHQPTTEPGPTRCDHCKRLCHSRSGIMCEDGGDARYPCDTIKLLDGPAIKTNFIVLRPAPGLPDGFMPERLNGIWYELDGIMSGHSDGQVGAVAKPAGRYETRADGAHAEVWEVTPMAGVQ